MNLHDLFAIPVHRAPGKPALRFAAENGTAADLSYAELFAEADRLAAGLHARGVRKGDRVAFFLSNRPEFVTAYLAVIRLGAVMVPVNLAYRRREIAHMLADAEPRLLLTERANLAVLDELADDEKRGLESVLLAEDLAGWTDAGDGAGFVPPLVEEGDLAMLLYTSGTTGRSKGALITHGNVMATMTGLLAAWAWEPADTLLLTLPPFHTHGLVVGLHCALAAAATLLPRPRSCCKVPRASSSASPPCTSAWSMSFARRTIARRSPGCASSAPAARRWRPRRSKRSAISPGTPSSNATA